MMMIIINIIIISSSIATQCNIILRSIAFG